MKNKLLIAAAVLFAALMTTSSSMSVLAQDDPFVGGSITVASGTDPLTLNPLTYGSIYEGYIIDFVYDALIALDTENNPMPILAESWEHSTDNTVWNFTIRSGAVWHDGIPLTLDDVEYTWNLKLGDAGLPRRSWLFDDLIGITKFPAENKIQAEFDFSPKSADILLDFATGTILPEHIWDAVGDIYSFNNEEPLGSGPFVFEEWETGQFIKLSRNPNYFLDGPWIEELIVQLIPSTESQYYALSTGEIEMMGGPPPELEALAEVDPNIEVHEFYQDYIMYLTMNQRRYPNNVLEFRQAVLTGINRDEIVDIARYGRGLTCPASMSLPYGLYYNPDIPQYDYDVAAAKALLDSIGFTDDIGSDGIREDANGTDLSFELLVSAEAQESVDTAKLIEDYMADIGVEVTLVPILFDLLWTYVGGPGGTYPDKYDYDWAFLGWVGFWSDFYPNWAYWMFSADRWWGSDEVNIPGWDGTPKDDVTALCDDILYTVNETEISEKLDEIQMIVATDLPYIPINVLGGVALYRTDEFAGYVMGNTTGPDNWMTWLNLHLIEPVETEVAPAFTIIAAVVSVFAVARFRKRKK
ncbi:MAG: ABC transporter substrate-binding protein [Candidatus Heimdallarchaeota archaeon]|nr:ABC transporter substrate-binding protein [Candidatus Heimdallarchaeota archaeon]